MNRFCRALESRYQAKIEEALSVLDLYLTKSVGVGDHSNILDTIDAQVSLIEKYTSKLQTLRTILPQNNDPTPINNG